jgi:hypothetical protein
VTRESIVEAARQAAAECGGNLSRSDFQRRTGIGQHHIYKLFPEGGWSEVKRLADLSRHPQDKIALSDDELLAEFHRVCSELGSVPTWAIFQSHAQVAADTVRRRFGGLQGTLKRYCEWLELHEPASAMLVQLRTASKHEVPIAPVHDQAQPGHRPLRWTNNGGLEYGAPINFRGLRHAPINEQGVVYLFGMVSYELGLIVEAIQAAYPDCEAKRCVDPHRDRWQRVRIEFEYQSRNFRDHGHDPAGCDLIVCWEHNWPECPLEVVELRRVIHQLEG